ncbi:MAG: hypothetical protein WBZ36_09505, partial [Candidatus Nitrosopolaris sp.]
VKRALDAEDNYNLLFIGPPASAKTLFLLGIIEYKKGVYFDGSIYTIRTTNRILDENRLPQPLHKYLWIVVCLFFLKAFFTIFSELQ